MTSKALEVYKLTSPPFELGRYDVPRIGRDSEWARLQQLIATVRESRAPLTGVLLGTYGAGKSFLLWNLAKSVENPKKSKVLSSGPMRLVDPEQKKDFTKSLILRFFARGIDLDEQLSPLVAGISGASLQLSSRLRPYADLILALGKKSSAAVARRVLTGGKALRKEAHDAGFPEVLQIKTADEAMSLLQALQCVVKAAGVEAVVFMVDEVEYVDNLGKSQRVSVLDSLKHIWDQEVEFFSNQADAAPLLMVLAATPNFWNKTRAQILAEAAKGESGVGLTPFFDRIRKSEIIEMPGELEEDEARKLIVTRMTEVRAGQKKEDIIPFTDDFVDYVYKLSQGLPRRIIEICGVVINEAGQRKLKTIDMSGAKKILRDLLLSYEPPTSKAKP